MKVIKNGAPQKVHKPSRDGLRAAKPRFVHAIKHGAIVFALLATPGLALAADGGGDDVFPRLGLDPGDPQVRSATPALPFGVQPAMSKEYVLDFHGYLLLPAELGVHQRENPLPSQSSTVLHSPALIPQDLRDFNYTGVVPGPWLQLNFIYGNSTVYATAILAGTSASDAASYYNPVDQFGVNDAYLTLNLSRKVGFPLQVNVGAYTGRYGGMGSYDAGRYGTPLIARTNTIGENVLTGYKFGDLFVILDQGLGGQLGRPPAGIVPEGWNGFVDPNVGATFVNQAHLGFSYGGLGRLGLHYLTAWTQDDQTPGGTVPNGRITVLGADVGLNAGRGGHLYVGFAHTQATNAQSVSGAIEIMNARGGPELRDHYLGADNAGNVNGSLNTVGAQYDLSLARLVFGKWFTGMTPEVFVSLFGVVTKVSSDNPLPAYHGDLQAKVGVEATYTFLSWMGVSERFDHVRMNGGDSTEAFSIFTSRLLFHSDWRSRDQIALQYSYFQYGSSVFPETGYPPTVDSTANPDRHVLSLTGIFWW
jgi:hypothetical protein